jgi:proteasome lid subunit RPN8/RPN11
LKRLIRLRCALKSVAEAGTDGCAVPRYLVAARFLREAHAAVTPTPNEGLTGVTGPEDGKGIFALERLVTFALAEASPVHAVPDPVSQSDALMALTGAGEQLLATFHSHPGRGPDATHPSKTDLSTQAQLERLGYPAIGAIFSRDGYARFYSKDRAFAVVVSGKGSEKVGDNLFRLKDVERPAAFRRRFAK